MFTWLTKWLFGLLGIGRGQPLRQLYLTCVVENSRHPAIPSFYIEAEGAAYLLFSEFIAQLRTELGEYADALSEAELSEAPHHCTVRLARPVPESSDIEAAARAAAGKTNMRIERLSDVTLPNAPRILCEYGVYTALAH